MAFTRDVTFSSRVDVAELLTPITPLQLPPSQPVAQLVSVGIRRAAPLLQPTGWFDDPNESGSGGPPQPSQQPLEFDGFLITWKPGTSQEHRQQQLAGLGFDSVEVISTAAIEQLGAGIVEWVRPSLDTEQANPSMEALHQLSTLEGVSSVDPNWRLVSESTNDPMISNASLWGLYGSKTHPNTNPYGSNAALAWQLGFKGSSNVYIGVIDTGFDPLQPDLWGNVGRNPGEIPNNGVDDDKNGYIDDIHGWDFFNFDASVYDPGEDQHGTHVAGTIGAVGNNRIGISGVSQDVSLLSAKFLGAKGGNLSDAIKAIDYFTDLKLRHGLNIVATNNSWGGGGYTQALADAIARAAAADILFIAAAGNSATSMPGYPASYPNNNIISVAALNSIGQLASFSNFGTPHVDLGAPGQSIFSTLPGSSYSTMSGTSMAAPHVTGAIALLAAAFPQASGQDLRNAILESAVATPSLDGKTVTGGRLDVVAALDQLSLQLTGKPIQKLPTLQITSNSNTVQEGDHAPLTWTLTRSEENIGDKLDVRFQTSGTATKNNDYSLDSAIATFQPGKAETQIAIPVIDDDRVEPSESVVITLLAGNAYLLGSNKSAGATILDNDLPTARITVTPESVMENEVLPQPAPVAVATPLLSSRGGRRPPTVEAPPAPAKPLVFTVTLDQPSPQPISLQVAVGGTATAGTDYTLSSQLVTIAAGQTSATLNVLPINDAFIEEDESVTLQLVASDQVWLSDQHEATGWIRNDDQPRVTLTADQSRVEEASEAAVAFTLQLSQPALEPLHFNLALGGSATPGVDYVTGSGDVPTNPMMVSLAAGETSFIYTLRPVADQEVEGDETIGLTLLAGSGYQLGSTVSAEVAIVEPSPPEPSPASPEENASGSTQPAPNPAVQAPVEPTPTAPDQGAPAPPEAPAPSINDRLQNVRGIGGIQRVSPTPTLPSPPAPTPSPITVPTPSLPGRIPIRFRGLPFGLSGQANLPADAITGLPAGSNATPSAASTVRQPIPTVALSTTTGGSSVIAGPNLEPTGPSGTTPVPLMPPLLIPAGPLDQTLDLAEAPGLASTGSLLG